MLTVHTPDAIHAMKIGSSASFSTQSAQKGFHSPTLFAFKNTQTTRPNDSVQNEPSFISYDSTSHLCFSMWLICKKETNEPFDPVGDWKYKVTTDVSYGVITIKKSGDKYIASMTTEVFGTLELMNLNIKDTELNADLDVAGTPAKIYVEFDQDEMKGKVATTDTEFPFIGEWSEGD